jgi:aarF domain-containing kinase
MPILTLTPTAQDMIRMQLEGKERVKHLLEDTNLIPRALIILGRSLNILRANNKTHGSIVNRVAIMAGYAAVGERHHNARGVQGEALVQAARATWRERVLASWDYVFFRMQLLLLEAVYYCTQVQQRVQRALGRKAEGFEDLLESSLAKTVEGKLGFSVAQNSFDPETG